MTTTTLSDTQRVLVELANAKRLLVTVNPMTKKIRGVRVYAAAVSARIEHEDDHGRVGPITVAMVMAMGLLKLGTAVDPGTFYVEATSLAHSRMRSDEHPRPMSRDG